MTSRSPWAASELAVALRSTNPEIHASPVDGQADTLSVVMSEHDDLGIILAVSGDQILASTLLWPVSDQENPEAFNKRLLQTHKLLPLSTFGITTVNGVEWYELFGSLSASATYADVLLELNTLARNALELAEEHAEQRVAAA